MPTIVEVTLLTILIEAIYEASNRLPENVVIAVFVFAYAALVGASQIITTKKENWKIIGVCMLIYGFSFLFSGNVIQHLYVGLKVPIYLHIPLQFIIPFALAMLLLLKKNTSQTQLGKAAG